MGKAALLIAVAEYRADFESLAAAENDLWAVQRVLQLPEAGGFAADAVKTLINPGPQKMREELEGLFANRRKDDLLVLYFSGHGVTDDRGNFYLASTATQRDRIKTTAVSARLILELMEDSRSKQQLVILDCCFSGAFANEMTAKGEPVNLGSQLGGQGRAVLTSSSATEYSFEQKESQLSVYTRYLVEGLETGAADQNGDGWIEVDELYEFTRDKVQEAAPAMQPKVYAAEAGYKIRLSKAPLGDPKLEYRKEVEKLVKARNGELSSIVQRGLDARRKVLKLSADDAHAIQDEVLKPYRERADKLRQYKEALVEACQGEASLSEDARADLAYFQQTLGLRDQDVVPIQSQIVREPIQGQAQKSPLISVPQKVRQMINPNPDTAQSPASSDANIVNPGQKSSNLTQSNQTEDSTPTRNLKIPIFLGCGASVLLGIGLLVANLDEPTTSTNTSPATPSATATSDEKTAQEYYEDGNAKRDSENYQGAIDDYTKAIELNPDYADAYNNRGIAKRALGDNQDAIDDYTKAIELNPNYADAYTNRGNAKGALEEYQGAIADHTKAIELNSDYALAYNNRGIAKRALGDNQGAIDDYNEAIQIDQNWGNIGLYVAYNNRGNAKEDSGDNPGAIDDYTKAIELNPDYAEAYYNRGIAKRALGDNPGAIDDYTKAIELDPNYAVAYNNRGVAKGALENYQGA
ncbi:MAG: tetratricopeptide repeat protein, partial [Cyanobacteria bacterium P01_A01_bin.123]